MAAEPLSPTTGSSPPDGEPLLTSSSYESAVAAVDALADARFPVELVTIVGRGVRTVERVTGRSGYVGALGTGALNGGIIGLFFGVLFDWWGALTPASAWGWLALLGLLYGAVAGGLIGLALHAFAGGGRRDFASAQSLQASRYEVVLSGGDRGVALRILREAGLVASGTA
jgi:hypothetical protein